MITITFTTHGRPFFSICYHALLYSLLTSLLRPWTDVVSALSVEGNLVAELLYGFSDVVALYALQEPELVFSLPLQDSADNVDDLLQQRSDFSLITGPLSGSQAQARANLTILPVLSVALVPIYRLDALNVSHSLTFSRSTLALIFAGNITSWDDPHIADDNPGIALPPQNVTVVFRADSSLSTLSFLTALNKFEPSISGVLPASALPDWPIERYWKSTPGTGPTGVVASVIDTDSSIGFCTQTAALAFQATIAQMVNLGTHRVSANVLSVGFGVTELQVQTASPLTQFPDTTDCSSAYGWPIIATVYLLLDNAASPRGCEVQSAVLAFWQWFYTSTSAYSALLYQWQIVPLPLLLRSQETVLSTLLQSVRCDGPLDPSAATSTAALLVPVFVSVRLQDYVNTLCAFYSALNNDLTTFTPSAVSSQEAVSQAMSTTGSMAVFYQSELATNDGQPAIDTAHYSILPLFLTSVVLTYNPQLTPSLNINTTELVVDWYTFGRIIVHVVVDWFDPLIVRLNPVLNSIPHTAGSAPIVVILACSGSTVQTPISDQLLTLMLEYAVQYDPELLVLLQRVFFNETLAPLFYACQPIPSLPIQYATSESTVEAMVTNTPGGIGYGMDSTPNAGNGKFAFLFPTNDGVDNSGLTLRRSTPDSLLACVEGSVASSSDNLLLNIGNSACWPFTQVVSALVPNDYPASRKISGYHTLSLLSWLVSTGSALLPWASSSMMMPATLSPSIQTFVLSALNAVTSGGQTLLVTLPDVWVPSSDLRGVGIAVTAFGSASCCLALFFTVRHRRHPIIKPSAPAFLMLTLSGLICLFSTTTLITATPSVAVCSAFNWMVQLGFTLTFCPLLVKTYRIWRIFGRRRLQVVKLSNRRLLAALVSTLLLELLYLLVWQMISPMSTSTTVRSNGEGQPQSVYTQCAYQDTSLRLFTAIAIVKAAVLVVGVLLAFSTRTVSDAFNESKSMGLAIYNVVFTLGLLVPILLVLDAVGDSQLTILLFVLTWISGSTLAILFAPKLISTVAVLRGRQVKIVEPQLTNQPSFSFVEEDYFTSSPVLQAYLAALELHTSRLHQRLSRLKAQSKQELTSSPNAANPRTILPSIVQANAVHPAPTQ